MLRCKTEHTTVCQTSQKLIVKRKKCKAGKRDKGIDELTNRQYLKSNERVTSDTYRRSWVQQGNRQHRPVHLYLFCYAAPLILGFTLPLRFEVSSSTSYIMNCFIPLSDVVIAKVGHWTTNDKCQRKSDKTLTVFALDKRPNSVWAYCTFYFELDSTVTRWLWLECGAVIYICTNTVGPRYNSPIGIWKSDSYIMVTFMKRYD